MREIIVRENVVRKSVMEKMPWKKCVISENNFREFYLKKFVIRANALEKMSYNQKKPNRNVSCTTIIWLFPCHTQNLIAYHCLCKHLLSFIDKFIYPRGSTNALYSDSCNSRPCEPNFTQLARRTNNTLLFWFMLFSPHISVAALQSTKISVFIGLPWYYNALRWKKPCIWSTPVLKSCIFNS